MLARNADPWRLPLEHDGIERITVDGCDLVRQRLDPRAMHGEVGIEQMREPDPIGLGGKPQQAAIGVEAVAPTHLDKLEAGLLAAIEETLVDLAIHPKNDAHRVVTEARDLHDFGYAACVKAFEPGARLNLIESAHSLARLQRQKWPSV